MVYLVLLRSLLYMKNCEKRTKQKYKKRKISIRTNNKMSCRICKKGKGVIPIFDNTLLIDIAQEIKNLSGVIINKTDKKSSKHLCKNCLEQLDSCIKFRELCRRNNGYWQNINVAVDNTMKTLVKQEYPETHVEEKEDISIPIPENFSTDNINKKDDDTYSLSSQTFSEEFNYETSVWKCLNCQEPFEDLDSYNLHLLSCNAQAMVTNIGDCPKRRFLCDICGKTISTRATLNIHRKIHKDYFPFHCDICPYRGRTIDLLRVHKRTHLTVKPYKCTLCPKTATTASNLQRHMRNAHSTARPFKCNHCERSYRVQSDLNKHVKEAHFHQDVVHCPLCDKTLSSQNALSKHRAKVHKIRGRNGRTPSYLKCESANHDMEEDYT